MTHTNCLIFALMLIFFCACSSNDDSCTPESVAGSYNFQSAECDPEPDMDMEDFTSLGDTELFVISVVDENTISIAGEDGEAIEFDLNGCSFTTAPITIDFFGITISAEYSGEFVGDEFQLFLATEFSGQIDGQDPIDERTSCSIVALKQ